MGLFLIFQLVSHKKNHQIKNRVAHLPSGIKIWIRIKNKYENHAKTYNPPNVFLEKPQHNDSKKSNNVVGFQIPKTTHHHRKYITSAVLMQPPVSQKFKIKRLTQAVLCIFRTEGQKEILVCFFIKKRLQKNLEKTIKKEQSCHKNHIGDL